MNITNKYFAKGKVVSLKNIRTGISITIAAPVFATKRRDNVIKTVAVEAYPNFIIPLGGSAAEQFEKENIKEGDFVSVEGKFRTYRTQEHSESLIDIEVVEIKKDISRLDAAYFIQGREYSTPENAGYVSGLVTEINMPSLGDNKKPAIIQIDISENGKRSVVRGLCYGQVKSKLIKEVHVGDEIKTFGIIQTPDKKENKDRKVLFYHNYTIYDYAIVNKEAEATA